MSFSKFASAFGALATIASLAAQVQAHGYVTGIVAGGTYSDGYLVTQYPYESDPPKSVGWTETATDLGFVDDYSSDDVICHKNGTNAQLSATVAAGGTVELQWSLWPSSHHGPVIDYLANCNGDCTTVDKTSLEFVKIDEAGLIDDTTVPGTWASDQLIANNNSWTVTIPSNIKAGNYVLRHEIIALHSAGSANGAQDYPQCINLEITGGGDAAPSGTLGTELYTATDAGILVNIYQSLTYDIPGPAIPSDFASSGSSGSSNATVVPSSTVASTTAPATTATSAPASSSVASATSIASSSISAISSVTSVALPASSTAEAASSVTAAPSAPAIISAISSLTAAVPTSVLTAAAPTATATTGSGQTISTAGMSVSELLDLLKQILTQLFTSTSTASSKARRHARDIAQ